MFRGISALVALTACGRIGFDAPSAPADTGSDATLPLCDRVTDALYCNDFNTSDLKGALQTAGTFVDNAGIDGSGGYVFVAPPSASQALVYPLSPFVSTGELHIGARMFIEGTASPQAFLVLAQFGEINEKTSFDAVMNNSIQIVNTSGVGDYEALGALPRDRWFCMELAVGVSNGPGSFVRAYVDDAMILEGYIDQDTLPDGLFRNAQLSAYTSAAVGGTFVVHADNWVVSTHPIGCP